MQRGLISGGLALLCAACLALTRSLLGPVGNPHLDAAETMTFSKAPLFVLPTALDLLCALILLVAVARWWRRREPGRWSALIALLLVMFGHQLLLAASFLSGGESWNAEDYISGQDGHRYYFLHCPPPLNGPGHYAVARRVGSSPLFFTVRTVGKFDRNGRFEPYLDANPEVAKAARVLWSHWKNGKQRHP